MMTLQETLDAVIKNCPNEYAVVYAEGMEEAKRFGRACSYTTEQEAVKTQCVYILSNIVDVDPEYDEVWDTDEAKEVIKCLKQHSK